jgi:hypothetical protein
MTTPYFFFLRPALFALIVKYPPFPAIIVAQTLRLHTPVSLQLHSMTRHNGQKNEGIDIDNPGSNIIRSGLIGSTPARLGNPAARRSSENRRRNSASADRPAPHRSTQEAFVVEVKRRLNSAKDHFLRHLGLYNELDEMPLGLIIDVWI